MVDAFASSLKAGEFGAQIAKVHPELDVFGVSACLAPTSHGNDERIPDTRTRENGHTSRFGVSEREGCVFDKSKLINALRAKTQKHTRHT